MDASANLAYRIKYTCSSKSNKGQPVLLDYTMYMKTMGDRAMMKWLMGVGPSMSAMQSIFIMRRDPSGNVAEVEKAVTLVPIGTSFMTVDAKSMFNEKANPQMYAVANPEQMMKRPDVEPLGTKSILGVEAKRFKISSQGYEQIFCMHPQYPIVLEMLSQNFEMTATDLYIGDIPDTEFDIPESKGPSFDMSKFMGLMK